MSDINEIKNDSQTYSLGRIYFYLTDGCNLRCRHCWISPKFMGDNSRSCNFLPVSKFKQIISEAIPLGLSGAKLTGGEPLLHPDIVEILTFMRDQNLILNLETNGVLCTPELAKLIAAFPKPSVGISLDGVDAKTHEWVRLVDGCFEDALQGIRNLVEVGVHPQIVMTVMRHNKDQMEAMVRLAEQIGVSSIKFNLVQPTERGELMHERGETLTIKEMIEIGRWVNEYLKPSTKLTIVYSQPLAFDPLNKVFRKIHECSVCGIKHIIGVLPNGSYALCGIGEKIPELNFGNVDTDRLADVWNDSKVICELRKGLPRQLEGVCGKCSLNSICLGSCIAQNYYRRKNLWAPYWYCEEAEKQGLFPASRSLASARKENV
jgi:SynChlorMet cassette radical SAM/SPASM protein ScmF